MFTTISQMIQVVDPKNPRDFYHERLNSITTTIVNAFITECISIINDVWNTNKLLHLQLKAKELNDKLKELNEFYRINILNVDSLYKKSSIYVMSHENLNLRSIIEKEFKFNFSWSKSSKNFDKRCKVSFTYEKMKRVFSFECAFLLSKYGMNFYQYNLQCAFIKVLIEYFNLETVDFNNLIYIYQDVINQDMNNIFAIQAEVGLQENKPVKPRKIKDKGRPTKEKYIEYLKFFENKPREEFKKIMAELLHCSTKTIQRDLEKFGLNRNYNKL